MEKKVLVCIASYNRQESLARFVKAIGQDGNCDIAIFDDKSPNWTIPFVGGQEVKVITAPEHRGKEGFWRTYNDIFTYCKEHEHEYYIIMPDDVIACPHFVKKAIEAYDKADCICLSPFLTNRSILSGVSRWGGRSIRRHEWGYETHYFDCCGIMKRDFFEVLNWNMLPIAPSPDPYRSSGVGRQITTRLQSAGKKMGHVSRTLLSTTDDLSSMNPEERERHPMWACWADNDYCVDVHMASLWRGGHIVKTAASLFSQPELHTLFVTLNNYTDEQYRNVCASLKAMAQENDKKVVIRRAKNKKGSNEKLSQLAKSKSKYIAFADDDIIYPADYLLRLINGCNIHNAAVSFHGGVLREWPCKKYYDGGREMKSWNISLDKDTPVDILGTGVGLLKRVWFTEDEWRELYNGAPEISMDDIYLSCILAQKGIGRFVLEHPGRCITIKPAEPEDGYVYDQYRDNDKAQVAWINEHYPQEALVRSARK